MVEGEESETGDALISLLGLVWGSNRSVVVCEGATLALNS